MPGQKIKRTIFAQFPGLRATALSVARLVRRTLRRPHQKHYAALRMITDDPDDLYLDIGANHGQSIESIRLYKTNPIISFEANPRIGEALRKQYPDESINIVGLGEKPGAFTLYIPAYKNTVFDARASILREEVEKFVDSRPIYWFRPEKARVESIVCNLRTLDSFDLKPFLIKIDVEGAEKGVIEGAMLTIERHRPILIVENAATEIQDMLQPFGYRRYRYHGGRLLEGTSYAGDDFFIPDNKRGLVKRLI